MATLAALLVLAVGTAAADDPKAARTQEALRRTQEALRQSQAEAGELAQSKTQAESKLKSTSDELEALRNSSKSTQSSLRSQLQTSTAAQADLSRQLEEAKRQLAALTAKDEETSTALKTSQTQLARSETDLKASTAANTSCEAKNLKLYEYSQDMATRYKNKGVWASMSQKEPVLGLGDIQTQTMLQEYHEKLAAQRIIPAAPPATH
jgi:chromosome segregation ATPase